MSRDPLYCEDGIDEGLWDHLMEEIPCSMCEGTVDPPRHEARCPALDPHSNVTPTRDGYVIEE